MENTKFHILEWQDLDGIEFFSLLTDPTRENADRCHTEHGYFLTL